MAVATPWLMKKLSLIILVVAHWPCGAEPVVISPGNPLIYEFKIFHKIGNDGTPSGRIDLMYSLEIALLFPAAFPVPQRII